MRTIYSITISCFLISLLLACTSGEIPETVKEENNQVIIAGKLIGTDSIPYNQVVEFYIDDLFENRVAEMTQIDENGNFKHITTRHFAQDIILVYKKNLTSIFVSPGDSIYVEIDVQKLDEENNVNDFANVHQPHQQFNRELNLYYTFFRDSLYHYKKEDSIMLSIDSEQYSQYLTRRSEKFRKRVYEYFDRWEFSPEFRKWAELDMEYKLLDHRMRYRWLYPTLKKISRKAFADSIPKSYYSFLTDSSLIKEEAFVSTASYAFINEYFSYLLSKEIVPQHNKEEMKLQINEGVDLLKARAELMIQHSDSFTRNVLLSKFLYYSLSKGKIKEYEVLNKEFKIKNEKLNKIVQTQYLKSKTIVSNSDSSSKVHFNFDTGKMDTTILDSIIEQFKGQVLYIDFWGPWCMPCKQQFPFLKNIKSDLNLNKITFIYLANRTSKRSWMLTAKAEDLEGEHYLLNDKQFRALSNQFNIKGVPTYMIVNQYGEIVNTDAPAPKDSEVLLTELNLLIKK